MDPVCPWDNLTPGTVRFCEERLCALIVEPSNTWSSLAYVIIGVFLLITAVRDIRMAMIALAQIAIGVGSFAFHATGALAGEFADQVGMFMLSCLILVYAWGHARGATRRWMASTYVAFVAVSTAILYVIPVLGIPLFGVQLASGLGWEMYHRSRAPDRAIYKNLVRGILIFVGAFAIWITDITGLLCEPTNHWVTGHAIWHVLCAVSIERLFRFYKIRP